MPYPSGNNAPSQLIGIPGGPVAGPPGGPGGGGGGGGGGSCPCSGSSCSTEPPGTPLEPLPVTPPGSSSTSSFSSSSTTSTSSAGTVLIPITQRPAGTMMTSAGTGSFGASSSSSSSTASGFSRQPIRYINGEIRLVSDDLLSKSFGVDWGHTRSYSNQLDSNYQGINGMRCFVEDLPQCGKDGSGNIAVIGIINDALWFDKSGSNYVARHFIKETLSEDTVAKSLF